MITSNLRRSGHPSRQFIALSTEEGERSGLITDSVVMTDNLATVADSAIYRIIGMLPMASVNLALKHTRGL